MFETLTDFKLIRCRAFHHCEWCDEIIERGEQAMYHSFIGEDGPQGGWMHPVCHEAMKQSPQNELLDGWYAGNQGKGCLLGGWPSDGAFIGTEGEG